MTGGTVVVLGRTGRNFAAGMSGGMAFVLDESEEKEFNARCNTSMVELSAVSLQDRVLLKRLVENHARLTGSRRAKHVLARWEQTLRHFVCVMPIEYKKALAAQRTSQQPNEGARYG
jgi:glutamate synthase (ferredoxin)